MSFIDELKRRKVLRVAAAYMVIAWVLIQVAATLEQTLELPDWFDKVTFAGLLLVFPVALLLSWSFDLRRDSSNSASETISGKGIFSAVIIGLVLAGSGFSYYLYSISRETVSAEEIAPSIAVLPFADMSPEGDQVWFANGVAEEILNVLAKTDGMSVASRTASFRFRGDDVDMKTVAAELNVATILEGGVRTQGDQLRITAQLINAEDGFHLWSDTFDRQRDDIFAVQNEIATSIAIALFGELGVDALPTNRFSETRSAEAHEFYLRGLNMLHSAIFRDRLPAIPEFERAIELDPNFVDALVGLARAKNFKLTDERSTPIVAPSLIRALNLDPNNANAVAELAHINRQQLRWLDAEQHFLRAIDLEPRNAVIRTNFGYFLRQTGRVQRALNQFLQAWELDSAGYYDLPSLIVNTHAYLGQFDEARAFYENRMDRVGLQNMRGNEAYFVSLLADGMEKQAREFGGLDLPGEIAPMRIAYFLDRLDKVPSASEQLVATTLARIEAYGGPRLSDIENLLLAGETDLAKNYYSQSFGFGFGAPLRLSLYVNDEIDPRYLPYRPNLLVLLDEYPDVEAAFMTIGTDLRGLAVEKGYLQPNDTSE